MTTIEGKQGAFQSILMEIFFYFYYAASFC